MNGSSERFESVFVVIDPERMLQPALIKGEWIAARDSAKLTIYCCAYDEALDEDSDRQKRELDQIRSWLDRLAAPAEGYGLDVTVVLEWNKDWRAAIVAAAKEANSGLVIKTASRHTALGRRLLKTADWALLADCSCPMLLVGDSHLWDNRTLLAAVKLKPEDPAHESLNQRIVKVSHNLAENAGFELHVATAYKGEEVYFDRQKFADSCGVPRNRIHAANGTPQEAISQVANEVGADVIIVGNAGDSKNDTARRLIDEVSADIFVLSSSAQPGAA